MPEQTTGRLGSDPRGYYAALGVRPDVGHDFLVQAFEARAAALRSGLSAVGDPEAGFRFLNEAFAVVGDPDLRRAYDESVLSRAPGEGDGRLRERTAGTIFAILLALGALLLVAIWVVLRRHVF